MKLIGLIEGHGHGGYRWGTPKSEQKPKRNGDDARVFTEYGAWRAACRLAPGFVKFEGDESGCVALFLKPRLKPQSVGAWNGESGTIKSSEGARTDLSREREDKLINAGLRQLSPYSYKHKKQQ